MEKNKISFYGGKGISLIPFVILIVMVFVAVTKDAVSERVMWVGAVLGLFVIFFLAKEKKAFSEAIAKGMADDVVVITAACLFFAGIFTTTLRACGLVDGILWAAYHIGATGRIFTVVTFIAAALFATAAGTGLGTTMAGMSVLYPVGCLLGANPMLLAGAIIGGGAFGDNLAPVSDTTICSAATQGVDVPGVVRSRLRYSVAASIITIIVLLIMGGGSHGAEAVPYEQLQAYMNPLGLLMLIPAVLTIVVAIKTSDVTFACIVGTVACVVVAVPAGLIDFSEILCFSDGTISGTIVSGIASMVDVVILLMLVGSVVGVMTASGGSDVLVNVATKVIRSVRGAELTIIVSEAILAGMTGINAPAILALGTPFVKPIGEKYKISPYRRANLLDAAACTINYTLPWTSIVLLAAATSKDVNAMFGDLVPAFGAWDVFWYPIYAWALLVVILFAAITGWGRKYMGPDGGEVDTLEQTEKVI